MYSPDNLDKLICTFLVSMNDNIPFTVNHISNKPSNIYFYFAYLQVSFQLNCMEKVILDPATIGGTEQMYRSVYEIWK